MNTAKKQIRDNDLASAGIALQRAAKRAMMIAEQTHTPLVVYEGGRLVKKMSGKGKVKKV